MGYRETTHSLYLMPNSKAGSDLKFAGFGKPNRHAGDFGAESATAEPVWKTQKKKKRCAGEGEKKPGFHCSNQTKKKEERSKKRVETRGKKELS